MYIFLLIHIIRFITTINDSDVGDDYCARRNWINFMWARLPRESIRNATTNFLKHSFTFPHSFIVLFRRRNLVKHENNRICRLDNRFEFIQMKWLYNWKTKLQRTMTITHNICSRSHILFGWPLWGKSAHGVKSLSFSTEISQVVQASAQIQIASALLEKQIPNSVSKRIRIIAAFPRTRCFEIYDEMPWSSFH